MSATRVDVIEDVYWRVFAERNSYRTPRLEVSRDDWRAGDTPVGPWADALRRNLAGAQSVLDVGAGSRSWEQTLGRLGIDARYASADTETRHHHDFTDFFTADGQWDSILMFELLEHLPVDLGLRFLQHAFDLLAPSGVVAISTPNPAHPTSFQQSDFTHVRPWPAHDLWGVCRAGGLDCEVHRILHASSRRRALVPLQSLLSRVLRIDPADHLLVFARKPAA